MKFSYFYRIRTIKYIERSCNAHATYICTTVHAVRRQNYTISLFLYDQFLYGISRYESRLLNTSALFILYSNKVLSPGLLFCDHPISNKAQLIYL
jgi:hypothetical protein